MNDAREQWEAAHRDMDMIVAQDLMWTLNHVSELRKKLPPEITRGWELWIMKDQLERSMAHATALRDAPSDPQETR